MQVHKIYFYMDTDTRIRTQYLSATQPLSTTPTNAIRFLFKGRKEMFYLMTHSQHFIYGYMASDIRLRTILIVRKETRCRHIGYSFRLTARVLLYAPSHRQDSTYTAFVTPVVEHWMEREIAQWVHPMKDRSDDPSHHERTLLPRSYTSRRKFIKYISILWTPIPGFEPSCVMFSVIFSSTCRRASLV